MKSNFKRFGWLVAEILKAVGTDDEPMAKHVLARIAIAAKQCGIDLDHHSGDDD